MQVYWKYILIVWFRYRSLQLSSIGFERVVERERKRQRARARER